MVILNKNEHANRMTFTVEKNQIKTNKSINSEKLTYLFCICYYNMNFKGIVLICKKKKYQHPSLIFWSNTVDNGNTSRLSRQLIIVQFLFICKQLFSQCIVYYLFNFGNILKQYIHNTLFLNFLTTIFMKSFTKSLHQKPLQRT